MLPDFSKLRELSEPLQVPMAHEVMAYSVCYVPPPFFSGETVMHQDKAVERHFFKASEVPPHDYEAQMVGHLINVNRCGEFEAET